MKTKIIFLSLFFASVLMYAQAPQSFKYQTIIRDDAGAGLPNQEVSVRVSIIPNAPGTTAVYIETHDVTTNGAGLVNLEIGSGSVVSGNFSTIDWGIGVYFLGIEVDPSGGSSYQSLGASQLLSVPYALFAEKVGNTDDADANPDNEIITNLALNGTNLEITEAGQLHTIDLSGLQDGTGTDDQTLAEVLTSGNNAGGLRITGLGTPVDSSDAVTKAYVDELKMIIIRLAPLSNLIDANVPANDLLAAGYTVPQLVAAGISVHTMMELGLSLSEIIQNGATVDELIAEGINFDDSTGVLLDHRDDKNYSWIGIGNQIWMSQNLNYVPDTGHYYSYLNIPAYADTFGRLYTWYTAQAVCPAGWSLPSDTDWATMEQGLGMSAGEIYTIGYRGTSQGDQLKNASLCSGGINCGISGFNAILAGAYSYLGTYTFLHLYSYYWTSDGSGANGYLRYVYRNSARLGRNLDPKTNALSVRCIKD